jgi:hypothetical protein
MLTIALWQGVVEVATLKQTYRLVAQNWRTAFPQLPSSKQWLTRVHESSNKSGDGEISEI